MSGLPWGDIIGMFTLLSMAVFIGIWIWAWRKRHRQVFKRMSEIPMEDPPEGPVRPIPPSTKVDLHQEDKS